MTERRMKSDQVRQNWRDVLDHVRSGGTVIVEHYNRPVARITPLEDAVTSTANKYALCWESAGSESAWAIRVLDDRPGAPENTWDLWVAHPEFDEDDEQYAKQWAEGQLASEGLTVEYWKRDKYGDWIPRFA